MHKNDEYFKQWLVGLFDGDGTFTISFYSDSIKFTAKIGLTFTNQNILYYIDNKLGNIGTFSSYGSV